MIGKPENEGKVSRRKEKETEWVREIIVEAAASMFSQKGYHGATMENIADAAGYSPAAIYKYFENKEAVFLALQKTMKNKLTEVFNEHPPVSLPFDDYLKWFLSRIFVFAENHRYIFLSFMVQRSYAIDQDPQTEFHKKSTQFYLKHMNMIADIMKKGIREKALKKGEPLVYAAAFFGIVYSFVFQWLVAERPEPLSTHIDTIVDIFLNGTGIPKENKVDKTETSRGKK